MLSAQKTVARIGALIAFGFAAAGNAGAAVVYDNGGATDKLPGGYVSDMGEAPFSQQMGDDFTLDTSANVIEDVHWWGWYGIPLAAQPAPDNFSIRIFEINAGAPDVDPLFDINVGSVGRAKTDILVDYSIFPGGDFRQVYEYWVDIAAIELDPDIPYLLSIVNDTSGTASYDEWAWSTTLDYSLSGNSHLRATDGDQWGPGVEQELAFKLTAAPEPATTALIGLGIAGIGFGFRRRRP